MLPLMPGAGQRPALHALVGGDRSPALLKGSDRSPALLRVCWIALVVPAGPGP